MLNYEIPRTPSGLYLPGLRNVRQPRLWRPGLWRDLPLQAIALVQQTIANGNNSASPIAATLGGAPTNGSMLGAIFSATWGGSGAQPTVTSISGDGVTWVNAVISADTTRHCEIWYGPNVQSGGTGINVTWAGVANPNAHVSIQEWSGIATSSPVDVTASDIAHTGTSVTTVSVTTTNANDLVIAAAHVDDSVGHTAGPTNSFTELTDVIGGDELFRHIKLCPA